MKPIDLSGEMKELKRLEKEHIDVQKKTDAMSAVLVLKDLKEVKDAIDSAYDEATKYAKEVIRKADEDFADIYSKCEHLDSCMRSEIVTYHSSHSADLTDIPGLSWREGKFVAIIDASKVPDEYKIPDMAKLNKLANAGIKNIPGIDIITKYTPVIR